MTETMEIGAYTRTRVGKANRALAREGRLPAVVYGAGFESGKPIEIDRHEFEQIAAHGTVATTLFKLSIDGGKPVNAMVKGIARDPVRGVIQHVDFWAIKLSQTVTTVVPLEYVGVSAGEKAGGVLLHELREVHVEARPVDLPEHIEVDVSKLEVGDSLHVGDLVAPEGVHILDDPEAIVCSVTTPQKAVEEEVTEGAAGEVEVIGSSKVAEEEE